MRLFSARNRPVPLGKFPLERIGRRAVGERDLEDAARASYGRPALSGNLLASIIGRYCDLYGTFREGQTAPEPAPYADSEIERTNDLKGLCYFFDASLVGLCRIPEIARTPSLPDTHTHAVVMLVESRSLYEADNPAFQLINGSGDSAARLRATEIAVILALYLRRLGFSATAQMPGQHDLALGSLAVAAGVARTRGRRLHAPFIGDEFALAAVTTSLVLPDEGALAAARPFEGGAAWHFGAGGTETWWNRALARSRPADIGLYPMETVKRVPETTTLIIDDEVPRLAKRSSGFVRARYGDLGEKAQREVTRFSSKAPIASATQEIIAAQKPHQDGPVAQEVEADSLDPERNSRAVKTIMLHLGADIVGTSEAKPYVWYSHHLSGEPIEIYHRSAVTMVIDQGFDTMEGASGDDWVSAAQSMRAYMRGAQIAGVTAAWIRAQGHGARSHTNIDSDVVQTPLVLLAGLGEMSRIGEVVLNPFIGPRSKSAVVTTNMPLAWDRPIDFGLQDSCAKCLKCARECPCDSITYGGTVMFNGYEQWKQDVQRCTSYRVTNQGGSACGRCMKTCPYNNEGLMGHRVLLWAATRFPKLKPILVRLDDKAGNGSINPAKRWWQELEIVDGKVIRPRRGNRRELDIAKGDGLKGKQKILYTNADMLPAPDESGPFPIDRKTAMEAGQKLETPAEARARLRLGGQPPAHYTPPGLKRNRPRIDA